MALHNGVDTVAYVACGFYSETYSSGAGGGNIASLFVSYGLLETAPAPSVVSGILKIVCNKIKGIMMYRRETQNTKVIK